MSDTPTPRREPLYPALARKFHDAQSEDADQRLLAAARDVRAQHRAARRSSRLGVLRGAADGQRPARRAPRHGPPVQGRDVPLQDHDRPPRACARRAGTRTDCRSSARSRSSSASRARRPSRNTGSRHSIDKCRESVWTCKEDWDEFTERSATGSTSTTRTSPTTTTTSRRCGGSCSAVPRGGHALPGAQGRAVLPGLRHAAVAATRWPTATARSMTRAST